jgi:hypothetical protein
MSECFAWYRYPEPEGTAYSETDLEDEKTVAEIFDYCQILLGFISARGWQKLIRFHGIDKLLQINQRSGWFDEEDNLEAVDEIKYQCVISGYDPVNNAFGEYNDESGVFTSSDGKEHKIVWGVNWSPAT